MTAPRLLAVAVHLVGDVHAAEDIVQATFLAAIESSAQYRPDAPVLSWLLGILANRAHYLKRQARRRVDPDRVAGYGPTDPSAAASEREFAEAFAVAIDALPEQYAQVVELHLTHGLTAKEIARALRRPAGTVRTQIVRAMELVRKALPNGFKIGSAVVLTIRRMFPRADWSSHGRIATDCSTDMW